MQKVTAADIATGAAGSAVLTSTNQQDAEQKSKTLQIVVIIILLLFAFGAIALVTHAFYGRKQAK